MVHGAWCMVAGPWLHLEALQVDLDESATAKYLDSEGAVSKAEFVRLGGTTWGKEKPFKFPLSSSYILVPFSLILRS